MNNHVAAIVAQQVASDVIDQAQTQEQERKYSFLAKGCYQFLGRPKQPEKRKSAKKQTRQR